MADAAESSQIYYQGSCFIIAVKWAKTGESAGASLWS